MTLCCYHCGKQIKGKAVMTNPSNLSRMLGDFAKSYHPKCWEKAEKEAEKELAR